MQNHRAQQHGKRSPQSHNHPSPQRQQRRFPCQTGEFHTTRNRRMRQIDVLDHPAEFRHGVARALAQPSCRFRQIAQLTQQGKDRPGRHGPQQRIRLARRLGTGRIQTPQRLRRRNPARKRQLFMIDHLTLHRNRQKDPETGR